MKEKVSVIIPTYNRENTILRAVQSVLDQTYTNIEVLIIDDGSTDGTVELVKRISDERVQCIVLEKNGGPSNARNIGAQMATGEWIAFQDSDDCWHRDKLELQMAYAKKHPDYEMIYCMCNAILESGEEMTAPLKPWINPMEGNMVKTLLQRNVIGAPTIVARKSAILKIGGFDTSYKALEDWDFVIRFAMEHEIGFVQEGLIDCYVSDSGVSSNKGAYYEARCKMLGHYKERMIEEGVLESVMQDILMRAQSSGVADVVKKMMMMYLCG